MKKLFLLPMLFFAASLSAATTIGPNCGGVPGKPGAPGKPGSCNGTYDYVWVCSETCQCKWVLMCLNR